VGGKPTDLKNALGRDMIYLETDNNTAAAEVARSLDIVKNVKIAPEGLALCINSDGTHILPVIMSKLKDKGIEITEVNLKKPTLDDVFVYYTGREIRNQGAEKLHRIQHKAGR
jgi:ABC-2 type transport system ATP-binding protein